MSFEETCTFKIPTVLSPGFTVTIFETEYSPTNTGENGVWLSRPFANQSPTPTDWDAFKALLTQGMPMTMDDIPFAEQDPPFLTVDPTKFLDLDGEPLDLEGALLVRDLFASENEEVLPREPVYMAFYFTESKVTIHTTIVALGSLALPALQRREFEASQFVLDTGTDAPAAPLTEPQTIRFARTTRAINVARRPWGETYGEATAGRRKEVWCTIQERSQANLIASGIAPVDRSVGAQVMVYQDEELYDATLFILRGRLYQVQNITRAGRDRMLVDGIASAEIAASTQGRGGTPDGRSVPGPVINLKGVGLGGDDPMNQSIRWSWETPLVNPDEVIRYEYGRVAADPNRPGFDLFTKLGDVMADETSFDQGGRNFFSSYIMAVRAVGAAGPGPATRSPSVISGDVTRPAPPGTLTARPQPSAVDLFWANPPSRGGLYPTAVTAWNYRVDDGPWMAISHTLNEFEVSGLNNDQEYTFYVRAVISGKAGPWRSIKATPAAVQPVVIGGFKSKAAFDTDGGITSADLNAGHDTKILEETSGGLLLEIDNIPGNNLRGKDGYVFFGVDNRVGPDYKWHAQPYEDGLSDNPPRTIGAANTLSDWTKASGTTRSTATGQGLDYVVYYMRINSLPDGIEGFLRWPPSQEAGEVSEMYLIRSSDAPAASDLDQSRASTQRHLIPWEQDSTIQLFTPASRGGTDPLWVAIETKQGAVRSVQHNNSLALVGQNPVSLSRALQTPDITVGSGDAAKNFHVYRCAPQFGGSLWTRTRSGAQYFRISFGVPARAADSRTLG